MQPIVSITKKAQALAQAQARAQAQHSASATQQDAYTGRSKYQQALQREDM